MQSKLYYASGALYANLDVHLREYFYEDGTLKTYEPYQEGRLHGEVCLYWPNGKLKRRSQFCLGVRNGTDQMWNDQGVLVDEGSYEQGAPVGMHRRWTRDGEVIEETYPQCQ